MAELGELQRGQRWAYRIARSSATVREAAVAKVGDKKVQVELVADRWEGKREWVSPARLEVQWDARDEHIAAERNLLALRRASPSKEERSAADEVLFLLVPLDIAEYNADTAGTATIHDVDALAALVGLPVSDLIAAPAHEHEGDLLVPWQTTVAIVRAAAARYPHRILREIEKAEQQLNDDLIDGTVITGPDGVDHHLSPDDVRARFEKRERPRLDRLRSIVGAKRTADLRERRDLLDRLRRSTSVARRALEVLSRPRSGSSPSCAKSSTPQPTVWTSSRGSDRCFCPLFCPHMPVIGARTRD
ncbi:hypothetical protein BIU95_10320 [Curtobacterium sp. MCBA15_007]|nr:hypothetical protein BIU95_10320 [Curtobacterium sp. MCBA15_007]